jgi:site-specific DNA recombinase
MWRWHRLMTGGRRWRRCGALIERIEVGPDADLAQGNDAAAAPEIVLTGAIAAMVELALGEGGRKQAARARAADHDIFLGSVKVVAGIGFEPMTFRL